MSDLYINEDNQSFYNSRPESEMTAEGVDALVDEAAKLPVTGIAFCINVQRALFESKVWETFYSDYDPEKGLDQPAEWRKHGARNLWLLAQRGIDHHARWLARCKHHGIEGWLSMRMNDCHGLKEYCEGEKGVSDVHWTRHWPSTFWREHPELRRAPYRTERSWEGAFDYSHKEVQDHHLALIKEAMEHFDMFGFELDWMRWGMMFAPGKEQAGLEILTDFMRKTRELADTSAKRVGHPVKLAVRIPAEPQTGLALGYDVPRWAEEGLVDMVILSSFLGTTNFDYPIKLWRHLLGPKVKIITNVNPIVTSNPYINFTKQYYVDSDDFSAGATSSAIHRGADGVHLFNHCPSKLLAKNALADRLAKVYKRIADLSELQKQPRRHAISYPQVFAPGEAAKNILPIPLTVPHIGSAFGRMEENITLRISLGLKPVTGEVQLILGFSDDTPELNAEKMIVRINGTICQIKDDSPHDIEIPENACQKLVYHVAIDQLQDDINIVEFVPPQVPGKLIWAELFVTPNPVLKNKEG